MKVVDLQLELLDDTVFSASSATEGAHESLDRVPGAALLGASAARLYRQLGSADAFIAFHSGRLRFGDGLPLRRGEIGWPVPLSWHHPKTLAAADAGGRLLPGRIFNRASLHTGGEIQLKQLRGGYVTASGQRLQPARSLRMKTAIDPATGRAAEAQLFGYQSLCAGQRFLARIEADDSVPEELFRQVVESLQGRILLGRSRSAEYGRVDCGHGPASLRVPCAGLPDAAGSGEAILWLLSDLCPADASGGPAACISPATLGLPAGTRIDPARSFVRARRYSPWNAARHGYDEERWVLVAGSVLVLCLDGAASAADVQQACRGGLGLYRECGLGQVAVNPEWLAAPQPVLGEPAGKQAQAPAERPDHPLLDWLEGRQAGIDESAEAQARGLAKDLRQLLDEARRFAGVPGEAAFGPSRQQWGRIYEAARQSDGDPLHKELFGPMPGSGKPIAHEGAEGWKVEILDTGNAWKSVAAWLKAQLEPHRNQNGYAIRVRTIAHLMRTDVGRRRH